MTSIGEQMCGSILHDGPVHVTTKSVECVHCGSTGWHDRYWYKGQILCGDCRYKARHGRWPARTSGAGNPDGDFLFSEYNYHGGHRTEVLHRRLEFDAVSLQHVEFLNNWLDNSKLSLR